MSFPGMHLAVLFSVLCSSLTWSTFLEPWALSSETPQKPRCVSIPSNMSLCHGMQYEQMRLPNLLEHDTIDEVIQASSDFTQLVALACHPDTRLFLCSLFAPICLPTTDREILPCRSLCRAVQQGCESRISTYGFSWPAMLSCDKFPEDNDMCLRPVEKQARDISCPACSQVATYENLVDHFCRSSLVVKGRITDVTNTHITVNAGRSLKKADRRRNLPTIEIRLSSDLSECPCPISSEERYLIMATKSDGYLTASLVLPWRKDKNFKRAIHQFQRLNCKSIGREIRESASRRPHYYSMRKHNTGRFSLL